MNIAVVQMPMAWTVEENTDTIARSLIHARRLDADVAVFPECATTGYTSKMVSAMMPDAINRSLRSITETCMDTGIAAVVGTPYSAGDDGMWNAVVAIGRQGELLAVCPKAGITRSETFMFQAGSTRSVFSLDGVNCTAILCREYNDIGLLREQITEDVQVIFWPGVISKDPDTPPEPGSDPCNEGACKMAKSLGAFMVQANWPHFLDWQQVHMGLSAVVSPLGRVEYECPADKPGIAVVSLDLSLGSEPPVIVRAWDESVFSQ